MEAIDRLLDTLYTAQERLSRQEIHRRAVAEVLPPDAVLLVDALPEGEYTQDEAAAALAQIEQDESGARREADAEGVPAEDLSDDDLHRELGQLHRTRDATFRRGPI